jgi:hypothetical protein
MLGYLRLSVQLKGRGTRGDGFDDAQPGVLGVEAEYELWVTAFDAEAQGLEVQAVAGLPLRHAV